MLNKRTLFQMNDRTLVMGVLNITPDSFSDGGLFYENHGQAVKRAQKMLEEGVDIIDIGGESTRPGSEPVSAAEELRRVIPVIQKIREQLGSQPFLSIDTYKSYVARIALSEGVDMVNAVGGFTFDPNLGTVIAEYKCPLCIYHIKKNPKIMQQGKITYKNVLQEIKNFFKKQISFGKENGVKRDQFIIDPGVGFGKTVEHNLEIIKNLYQFKSFRLPILIGISRKSHLGLLLKDKLNLEKVPEPSERLEASLAETAIACFNGATIVRTHDVLETKKFLSVLDVLQ